MVNTNMLRAQMVLHNFTIEKLAKELDVSSKTLSERLNNSPEKFTQKQMQKLVNVLNTENPVKIFLLISNVKRNTCIFSFYVIGQGVS